QMALQSSERTRRALRHNVKIGTREQLDARVVVEWAHRLPPFLSRQPKRLPYNSAARKRAVRARRNRSTSAGSLNEYLAAVGCDCSVTRMPMPRWSSVRKASSSVLLSPM